MSDLRIQLESAVLRHPDLQFSEPLNWSLKSGEQWVVIGPNGAGKTRFAEVLTGKHALKSGHITRPWFEARGINPSEGLRMLSFHSIYGLTDDYRTHSYQQRWHSDESDLAVSVRDILGQQLHPGRSKEWINRLQAEDLLDKRLIHLSSGELRRFLLIQALCKTQTPALLILDNPYIGLDAVGRSQLNKGMQALVEEGIQLILLLSNPDDIPAFCTDVQVIDQLRLTVAKKRTEFLLDQDLQQALFPEPEQQKNEVYEAVPNDSPFVIECNSVHIQYGKNVLLHDFNWSIRKGEKWALRGPNGSGKSTLLSLIHADNPQAYANDIRWYGKKRGSGESIWDIKRNIGYISPELHHYYQKDISCLQVVGSGLHDSIGLYKKLNATQQQQAIEWMARMGIKQLVDRPFLRISYGEQRMCLLARALVKNPGFLLLDEPLHGLDRSHKYHIRQLLDEYARSNQATMIYISHYPEEIPACVTQHKFLSKITLHENK